MAGMSIGRNGFAVLAVLAVTACEPGAGLFQRGPGSGSEEGAEVTAATSVRLVDRDVEAPEIFQITDQALWDGRPSLGGVWVASPDTVDPERVIMRNSENGKFVIGALFRRERDNPGPALQISSDAAAALGLLAGEPGTINVTALRREEEAPRGTEKPARPILDAAETVEDPAPAPATTAKDTASIAAAAIAEPEGEALVPEAKSGTKMDADALVGQLAGPQAKAVPADREAPAAKPAAKPASGGSLIQIGIFSVEANAKRAVDALAKGSVSAAIRSEQTQGKTFWNVTARGDATTLQKVKSAGFADAYVLKR